MSHYKIKAAARQRVARTGESYAVARLAVIREYQLAQRRARLSEEARSKALEGIAVELARYGQHVRAQIAYPSGLAEIHRRFAAQAAQSVNAPVLAAAQAAQAAVNAPVLAAAQAAVNAPVLAAAQHLAWYWYQQGN